MYRGMTHYEFILALHHFFHHFELIVCELSTVSKNKHELIVCHSQAYIKKGHTPIQVYPVMNAYTNSFVVCSCILCISI